MGILWSAHPRRGTSSRFRWVALLAALALFAAACGTDDSQSAADDSPPATADDAGVEEQDGSSSDTSETDTDAEPDDGDDDESAEPAETPEDDGSLAGGLTESEVAEDRPVGTIDWETCGALECGTLDVPLDYRIDDGETISIAVNRVAAADPAQRIGSLLVNPGGPGAPGTDFAEAFAFGAFPEDLTDRFDIIGFDPRGVGASEPAFACGASGEQLEVLSDIVDIVDEPAEDEAVEAAVQLCVDSMGDAAGLIHTGYVARDMNEIRRALGEEEISYLGFSYGSIIGVWYATLFPETVRAMVIDGADNPIDDISDFDARLDSAREQITPIEDLLDQALGACSDSTCPIFNDGDPQAYYLDAIDKLPLVADVSANNPDAGFLGLITPLYNETQWPLLWDALADLEERDDPTLFADFAEFQLGPDPGLTNITGYINCLDSWALQPEDDREARLAASAEFFAREDELVAEFPLIGAIEDGLASTCTHMDILGTPALGVPFDGGGAPILVVGNTSDPVTSFGESEELVEESLANGFLVEVDHASHTVYPSNPCVNDAVHAALLSVDYPDARVVCDRVDSDTESILIEVCLAVAPQIPGLDADADLGDICQNFATASLDRLGEDTINAGLNGTDDSAAEALFGILEEQANSGG